MNTEDLYIRLDNNETIRKQDEFPATKEENKNNIENILNRNVYMVVLNKVSSMKQRIIDIIEEIQLDLKEKYKKSSKTLEPKFLKNIEDILKSYKSQYEEWAEIEKDLYKMLDWKAVSWKNEKLWKIISSFEEEKTRNESNSIPNPKKNDKKLDFIIKFLKSLQGKN